jgi:cell division protein FtsW (lipid II flippase)
MGPTAEDARSPVMANIVVIVGFIVLFTTFVTDSPWSWIIGGLLIVAGALWAGATPAPSQGEAVDAGGQRHGHDS